MSNKHKHNYSKVNTQPAEPVVEETVEETVEEAVEETVEEAVEENTVYGIVKCNSMLNVRKAPNADALVICTIKNGAEVIVDEKESTEDFYKVCTETGVEGFCMKKFIAVK